MKKISVQKQAYKDVNSAQNNREREIKDTCKTKT